MQDTLVSARMPLAKKERARGVLESLGATTSDLINNAFDYVIETGELPAASTSRERSGEDWARFVEGTTFEIAWPDDASEDGRDYKQFIQRMRLADYESLA